MLALSDLAAAAPLLSRNLQQLAKLLRMLDLWLALAAVLSQEASEVVLVKMIK